MHSLAEQLGRTYHLENLAMSETKQPTEKGPGFKGRFLDLGPDDHLLAM